jgi:DNA-binding NarL/FixJ family response regulator
MTETTPTVRLLLVDDNPAVRGLVVSLLPSAFEVVGTVCDGTELRGAIEQYRPDIVVLDVTLPGQSGFALASQVLAGGCRAKIVFLTVHNQANYVRTAFAMGGAAYVVKTRLALDIVPALQAVLRGDRFVSPVPGLSLE